MARYIIPMLFGLFFAFMAGVTIIDTTALIEDTRVLHTISYKNIPGHADIPMTELALLDAVLEWNTVNNDIYFVIVEYESNVKIVWRDYMKDGLLGEYRIYLDDEGEAYKHRIVVGLGTDDCNLDYQLFPYQILKHTIMHEMGHYLGLEHTDDVNHLMHSYDMSDEELAQVYDDLNLNIPYTEKPKIPCV